ncbi:hypothetical protein [Micromonospora sp. M71_S20]|uniref:hypothetical protein n=1 Tax=Micromonospora sp. M71_S20 TaxID=592872 RepID=UPI000EB3CC05|nr:hypothetical protein [Micromonospora sp. M71_S20]
MLPGPWPFTLVAGRGLDEGTAAFLAALDGNLGAGIMAYAGDGLTRLIGHPTTSLVEGLSQ